MLKYKVCAFAQKKMVYEYNFLSEKLLLTIYNLFYSSPPVLGTSFADVTSFMNKMMNWAVVLKKPRRGGG